MRTRLLLNDLGGAPRSMAESGPDLGGKLTYHGHEVAGSADPSSSPVNLPLLSRFAPVPGVVTLSQTFVRPSHGGNCPCPGASMMSNGTSCLGFNVCLWFVCC